MKILIVYATYSSGTETAAIVVENTLKLAGNNVELINAIDTPPTKFKTYDLIIFGSPSWWVNGQQGQPHEHMVSLFTGLKKGVFDMAKCAVFGLGHKDYYINFCMAVEIIEKSIISLGGTLIAPSLKINEFFFHQKQNEEKLIEWTKSLIQDNRLKLTLNTLKKLSR